jgi:hypothetical protein
MCVPTCLRIPLLPLCRQRLCVPIIPTTTSSSSRARAKGDYILIMGTIAYQFLSSLAKESSVFSRLIATQHKYCISQTLLQPETNMWLSSTQWDISGTGRSTSRKYFQDLLFLLIYPFFLLVDFSWMIFGVLVAILNYEVAHQAWGAAKCKEHSSLVIIALWYSLDPSMWHFV